MVLFEVVTEFEYPAQAPDELNLQVGDIVKVTSLEDDAGWWRGIHNGKEGLFPNNFVKKIESKAAPPPAAVPTSPPPTRATSPPAASAAVLRKVKVDFDYQAQEAEELSLKVGQIVRVIAEDVEGWWKGEVNGQVGLFPSNFVTEIHDEEPAAAPPPKPKEEEPKPKEEEPEQTPESKLKKIGVSAGGIGSLFAGGVPKLQKRSQSQAFPDPHPEPAEPQQPTFAVNLKRSPSNPGIGSAASAPREASPPPPAAAAPAPVLPSVKIRKAKALYDYAAADGEELTLTAGDILTVTGEEGDGWWKGTNAQGASGLFPSNFVEEFFEVVQQEPPKPARNLQKPAVDVPKPPRPSDSAKPPSNDNFPPKPAKPAEPPVPAKPADLPAKPAKLPIPAKHDLPQKSEEPPAAAPSLARAQTVPSRPPLATPPAPEAAAPPPVFEKKRFNAPLPVPSKPAAAEPDNELFKKLSVRNAVAEGELPPKPELVGSSPSSKPPVAAKRPPSLYSPSSSPSTFAPSSSPATAAPASSDDSPATASPAVDPHPAPEEKEAPMELEPSGPKLQHVTKDRPKMGGSRRKPQASKVIQPSTDAFGDPVEAKPSPPSSSSSSAATSLPPPKPKPFVEKPHTEAKPALPDEKPKLPARAGPAFSSPSPATSSPASASPSVSSSFSSATPATLLELKELFEKELNALRKELAEEKALSAALRDRVTKLEAKVGK